VTISCTNCQGVIAKTYIVSGDAVMLVPIYEHIGASLSDDMNDDGIIEHIEIALPGEWLFCTNGCYNAFFEQAANMILISREDIVGGIHDLLEDYPTNGIARCSEHTIIDADGYCIECEVQVNLLPDTGHYCYERCPCMREEDN